MNQCGGGCAPNDCDCDYPTVTEFDAALRAFADRVIGVAERDYSEHTELIVMGVVHKALREAGVRVTPAPERKDRPQEGN